MLEGMYTAAAGMAAQQQRLDAVAGDLANVSTTGYKKLRVAFRDLVYSPTAGGAHPGVQEGSGAAATVIGRGAAQGALQRTDRPLDVALNGPGFLRVTNGAGRQVLTRDGALQIDRQNRLVTASGHRTGVSVPAGTSPESVAIGPDGRVTADGRAIGRLDLVAVNAPAGLLAQGDNTFAPTAASGAPAAARTTTLEQGALEASNVDVGESFTEMIESQRAYELGSRAIRMQDELLGIASGVKR